MIESMLDRAAEGLYRELNASEGDLAKIPEVTRPIALLYQFQAMVDNGGFRYPFEADFPGNPPYSLFVDAYRSIGSSDAADALEQAIALFPFVNPERNADARNAFMPSNNEGGVWNELSDRVCGDKTIWKQMDEYVAKHKNAFAPFITQ